MNTQESSKPSNERLLGDFPKWIHAFAWGGIFVSVLLVAGFSDYYDGRNIWQDWTEARELRQPSYAERIDPEDVLRTRANSWSNLAYVLVGLYAVGLAIHDARRMLPRTGAYLIKTPVLGLVTMIFARLCWDLDKARKFSGPEAWLQGHAIWHLLTALSLFSSYFFYRTEPVTRERV